jgi:hypothetical protein
MGDDGVHWDYSNNMFAGVKQSGFGSGDSHISSGNCLWVVVALCFVEGIKGKNIIQQEGTSTSGELGASSFGRDFGVPTSDTSRQICRISQSSCGHIWTSSSPKL